jgi:hypothetical protein
MKKHVCQGTGGTASALCHTIDRDRIKISMLVFWVHTYGRMNYAFIFISEEEGSMFLRNNGFYLQVHNALKTNTDIVTAMRTSNDRSHLIFFHLVKLSGLTQQIKQVCVKSQKLGYLRNLT